MSAERWEDDRGAALMLALIAMLMLLAASTMFVTLSVDANRSTKVERDFETALHAAEAATDAVILEVSRDQWYATHEWDDPADERAWAIALWDATDPDERIETPWGSALGIRPYTVVGTAHVPMDVVYGVGQVTGGAGIADRVRVLKLAIDHGIHSPDHALLTQGALTLRGGTNAAIDGGGSAGVHTNGGLTLTGNPTVDGDATASGSVSGTSSNITGTVAGTRPTEQVPDVTPRALYTRYPDYADWYDLCPDGNVRQPPAAIGGLGDDAACTGTVLHDGTSGAFRGWSFNASQNDWRLDGGAQNGVYYVHHANVRITARITGPPSVTILVAANPSSTDASEDGNIEVTGNPVLQPRMQDLLFLADRDIKLRGTPGLGDTVLTGFIGAGEQIDVAGNTTIDGAVVAADRAALSSVVTSNDFGGSAQITYRGGLAVPLAGLVRIAGWNEL